MPRHDEPALIKQSDFATESYPVQQRTPAWHAALTARGLQARLPGSDDLSATLTSITSPQHIEFNLLRCSAQELFCPEGPSAGDILLCLHLEGQASLAGSVNPIQLKSGDIAYRIAGASFSLSVMETSRFLLVRVPRDAIRTRMPTPLSPRSGVLRSRGGVERVFSALLTAVATSFASLDATRIQPIDIALSEFLVTSLANDELASVMTGSTSTQTAVLHRISQLIESNLDSADLSIGKIAQEGGVSPRYLQKLFESANDNFSHYVRARRLERCRADLINPVYAHLSISDICFRWSFNDSAHFSRAFKEQYGVSPRRYRREVGQALPEEMMAGLSRGWPELSAEAATKSLKRNGSGAGARGGQLQTPSEPDAAGNAQPKVHHIPVNASTVHWGYFSASIPPVLEVESHDIVTMETLTHHAYDDHARMIQGDHGAEDVFQWTATHKNIDRRGAGPMDASIYGRGAGEGFGVHICTGPVFVRGAEPGDVLEIRILDVQPRPSANPEFKGRTFGSNAAAWWGYHYNELLTEPRQREVITIYEVNWHEHGDYAHAVYNFRWTPQTDPFGVVHAKIDYPGIPVDHGTIVKNHNVLRNVRIPVQPHFGVLALAPNLNGLIDSVPPSHFGGNIDNKRAGKGATMYLPVSVPGALFSVGDPHASQGDSELCGTAIECSMTGIFQLVLHKKGQLEGTPLLDLNYPLLETPTEWVVHGFSHANYIAELGEKAPSEVYKQSSLDLAMQDAFRKMRRLLMSYKGLSEDEALSLISVAVDFGITQVVDGNWCVHGILRKELFLQAG